MQKEVKSWYAVIKVNDIYCKDWSFGCDNEEEALKLFYSSDEYKAVCEIVYVDKIEDGHIYSTTHKPWYAVIFENNPDDWGTGSFDKEKALKMLYEKENTIMVAVIDGDICIEEILKEC